jgi:two-component system, OmpR family, sensor histidine kinase QseC
MRSIRAYLILALVATIFLVNFVAAFHGYHRSIAAGDRLMDKQLIEMAQSLEQLDASGSPPGHLFGDGRLYQILGSSGQLLFRSANAPDVPVAKLVPGYSFASHNGLRWRVYVLRDMQDRWIIAAQRSDLYTRLVEQMVLESILPIIWVLPVIALLVLAIVGIGLQPLKKLAGTLLQRRPGELTPIERGGYPAELTVVVASINELLGRLSDAFDREQRFAADAAHELRTPLAAIKIDLHNLGSVPHIDQAVLTQLESSVDRMGQSIEQILTLYRFSPERLLAARTHCNLRQLAQQVIIELYDGCVAKQQNIELEAISIDIEGQEFALHALLRNLIDNAVKYTPSGGTIRVSIAGDEAYAHIYVEDSGPGIPEADLKRVFDRFYRVGGDRHASSVIGSGLGLSIVDHIVSLHGGRIALGKSILGGLRVEIDLPRTPHLAIGASA